MSSIISSSTKWTPSTFKSVCLPTKQWSPNRELRESFKYIDVSAVGRQSYEIESAETVDAKSAPSRARKIVRTNDCIFATVRPRLLRVAHVGSEYDEQIASTAFCVLRVNREKANSRFIYFLLRTSFVVDAIATHESGASYPAVSDSNVLDCEILLPSIHEQEKIAAILWKLQRAIATQDRLIATTRDLKQSAMAHLFTHGLRGEALKETEIGPRPKSWRVDRLVELAHFQRGFDITKKQQTAGHVPVVSSGGIKSWHTEAKATGPGVVIGRKGSIGTVHYVEVDYWPHDTSLWATDFKGNVPLFVYYRLSVLDLARLDSGSTNPALNRNLLHEEIISWPTSNEQREIAAALATIDRKLIHHQKKRAALSDLFQTLLHKLMSAEIRVADLEIDTSEVTAPTKDRFVDVNKMITSRKK